METFDTFIVRNANNDAASGGGTEGEGEKRNVAEYGSDGAATTPRFFSKNSHGGKAFVFICKWVKKTTSLISFFERL